MQQSAIIREILKGYPLYIRGIHGLVHWARVHENGVKLAEMTGANVKVVKLFALFHDSRRVNDHSDPSHGLRGAKLAATLRGKLFDLSDAEFALLHAACAGHTDGLISEHPTIATCWDADRLDLGRCRIMPDPDLLSTDAAWDLLEWAHERASTGFVPALIKAEWKV